MSKRDKIEVSAPPPPQAQPSVQQQMTPEQAQAMQQMNALVDKKMRSMCGDFVVQIASQSAAYDMVVADRDALQTKYNDLLNINAELERKLADAKMPGA